MMSFETQKIILLLLAFTPFLTAQQFPITPDDIFGVRWFLGQEFRLQPPIPEAQDAHPNCHLMLMFNSHSAHQGLSFSVLIGGMEFGCWATEVGVNVTSDHHGQYNQFASKVGDTFTTFIHKCPLSFHQHQLQLNQFLSYRIMVRQNQEQLVLFEGRLRSPAYGEGELSIATLGDWGIISNFSQQYHLSEPITLCLLGEIEKREDLKMLMLLGDLGYDLEGKTYVDFLSYLQAFSSQLVMLITPGNHESIRHEDIFLLFKESFYSPSWSRFFGYFDLVSLRGNVFLGYNPEHLFGWLDRTSHSSLFQLALKDEFQNFTNLFSLQFSPNTRQIIKSQPFIAFSHYPTYCSKQDQYEDCDKYKELASGFSRDLQEMGVDLFFSGHVHSYERTKQLCEGDTIIRAGVHGDEGYQYYMKSGCSIFVIEGVAGNNYFVDTTPTEKQQLKNHSESAISNTGFGVLTINYRGTADIHFSHISMKEGCWSTDEFVLHANTAVISNSSLLWEAIGMLLIVCVGAIVLTRCWLQRHKKKKSKFSIKLNQQIIEMTEDTSRY